MRKLTYLLPILILAIVAVLSSIFVVDERERALVLQFGQIKRVKEDPGLAFKIPLIQQVAKYDDRILSLDTETIEVTPSDDRRLVVDAFARYRIGDVVQFRQAVGGAGVGAAEDRLNDILVTQIREVLGSEGVTSNTILSADRAALMSRIRQQAEQRADALGLDVVDVRLKQTNLPVQNLEATFARMRAEREREAADEVARGEEAAQRVRAQADRTVVELVSEARRESEVIRGEADAQRSGIYAEAYGANTSFFEFYRSLTAYERALRGDNSSMVITPDSEFFNYLDGSGGSDAGGGGATVEESAAAGGDETGGAGAPAEPAAEPAAGGGASDGATAPAGSGDEAAPGGNATGGASTSSGANGPAGGDAPGGEAPAGGNGPADGAAPGGGNVPE